jgi:hypothetical protein
VTIAHLLGLRDKDSPPSVNELAWWQSYRAIVSSDALAQRSFNARIIALHAGKRPAAVIDDPWDKLRDPDFLDSELEDLKRIKKENLDKANLEKELKENGEDSRTDNT